METPPFPNLFVETLEPTFSSILVFAIADLRRLVRESNDGDYSESVTRKVLGLPCPGSDLMAIAEGIDDATRARIRSNEYNTVSYMTSRKFREEHPDLLNMDDITVHHVGDGNAQNECVHTIVTNRKKKQVILAFRGSITMQDWITDATLVSGDLENPLYRADDDTDEQSEFVGVHLGFRDYLYDGAQPKSKIELILDQIQALLNEHPGYRLQITGHSLGGSLALLFSLQAAVRFATDITPVTCVTIGSPRVGDNYFRGAIQSLERQKRLRCLTVHNFLDLVPSLPNRICRCDFCRPNMFCQPGIKLTLREHRFSTSYHREQSSTRWAKLKGESRRFIITICCWASMAYHHNYRTYLDRLVAQKEELSKIYLNDLYAKESVYY